MHRRGSSCKCPLSVGGGHLQPHLLFLSPSASGRYLVIQYSVLGKNALYQKMKKRCLILYYYVQRVQESFASSLSTFASRTAKGLPPSSRHMFGGVEVETCYQIIHVV